MDIKIGSPKLCTRVAKVMFLHLSVCPQGGGSVSVHARIPSLGPDPLRDHSLWEQMPPRTRPPRTRHPPLEQAPPEQTPTGTGTPGSRRPSLSRHPPWTSPPPPVDGYCCGWYASYWNAFLCLNLFTKAKTFTPFFRSLLVLGDLLGKRRIYSSYYL